MASRAWLARAFVLICLLLSTTIDLFFYTGFYASDDVSYLLPAKRLLETGRIGIPDLGGSRLLLVLWNAGVGALTGFSIPLIAGSYVVFHQLANWLTYRLGRDLFDARVGLLAMYLVALLPLAITHSTMILPDLPLTVFMLLSLLACLRARRLCSEGKSGTAAWFLTGLCSGLGYLAKEPALLLAPFYGVAWLVSFRRPLRRWALDGAALATGFLTVMAVELAAWSALTGEAYVRMESAVADAPALSPADYRFGYYPLERLATVGRELRYWSIKTRFDLWLLLAAAVYPFVRGRRLLPWSLAMWFFAYHTWGSSRLSAYDPPSLQARYFTPVLVLLFIPFAFLALKLLRGLPRLLGGRARPLQAVLLALLLIHPWLGLRVADRMAGKSYDADVVGNALRAIEAIEAVEASGPPIVLSGTVSQRLHLVIPAGRALAAEDAIASDVSRTSFYYVELVLPPARPTELRTAGVDLSLHPAISSLQTDGPAENAGAADVGGRAGRLRIVDTFHSPHSRSRAVLHRLFGAPLPVDRSARAVRLYLWEPDSS